MASHAPAVQNENLHIHGGKAAGGAKADVRKPVKSGRQERKALADLSRTRIPLQSAVKKGAIQKERTAGPIVDTAKKAPKSIILTDEEVAQCREWAKGGIEHMPFSGTDKLKLEKHQLEERVKKKVAKAMSGLKAWTDASFGMETPVKAIPLGGDDILKLEFEPELLPPSPPRTNVSSKSGHKEFEDLCELEYGSLYFDQTLDIRLKEDIDSDTAWF